MKKANDILKIPLFHFRHLWELIHAHDQKEPYRYYVTRIYECQVCGKLRSETVY